MNQEPTTGNRILTFLFDTPAGYYIGGFLNGTAITASIIALVLSI